MIYLRRLSRRCYSQDGRDSVRFNSDPIRFRFAPVPVHTQFRFKTVPVHTGSRVVDLKMVFFGCPCSCLRRVVDLKKVFFGCSCSCLRRVVDLKKVFFGCPKSTQNTGSGSRPVPVHTGSGSQKFRFTRFRLIEKRFGSRPPCKCTVILMASTHPFTHLPRHMLAGITVK